MLCQYDKMEKSNQKQQKVMLCDLLFWRHFSVVASLTHPWKRCVVQGNMIGENRMEIDSSVQSGQQTGILSCFVLVGVRIF